MKIKNNQFYKTLTEKALKLSKDDIARLQANLILCTSDDNSYKYIKRKNEFYKYWPNEKYHTKFWQYYASKLQIKSNDDMAELLEALVMNNFKYEKRHNNFAIYLHYFSLVFIVMASLAIVTFFK